MYLEYRERIVELEKDDVKKIKQVIIDCILSLTPNLN